MPRAVNSARRKERRKAITRQTKGYWGRRKNLHRTAKDALAKAYSYAYRDRKARKRDFRRLWVTRISAACRNEGITYSRFVQGLRNAQVQVNRKAISNMAIEDPEAFRALVDEAKRNLG